MTLHQTPQAADAPATASTPVTHVQPARRSTARRPADLSRLEASSPAASRIPSTRVAVRAAAEFIGAVVLLLVVLAFLGWVVS